MAAASGNQILYNCRYWLSKFGIHTENIVTIFDVLKIPNWIVYIVYSMPMAISVVLSMWYIIENKFNLNASSVATVIIFGGGQIQLIYLIMAGKSTELFELIFQLENLVSERKLTFFLDQND